MARHAALAGSAYQGRFFLLATRGLSVKRKVWVRREVVEGSAPDQGKKGRGRTVPAFDSTLGALINSLVGFALQYSQHCHHPMSSS